MKISIKTVLFSIWLAFILFAIITYLSLRIPISEIPGILKEFISGQGPWGPILYILVYAFHSLIFFPASLLAVISGLLFGPVYGILFTLIGENISGNISFVIGRYFGSSLLKHLGSNGRLIPLIEGRFRENGFLAVLTMRLSYFPFDLVGYMSGVCDIRQRDFALATCIGTIPGLTTFVLMGSGFVDIKNFAIAFVFLAFGWILSRRIKEWEKFRGIVPA